MLEKAADAGDAKRADVLDPAKTSPAGYHDLVRKASEGAPRFDQCRKG